ncbi:hypothetical protein Golax_022398 [Gossypium laxum]|uniref:Uncharacterized protein n=1 Tax=Gossypium laxum TaxID=34288 RepID=A0A7J9APF9_9ROSI|nr:hypothetical protein [Gossypium laxum]
MKQNSVWFGKERKNSNEKELNTGAHFVWAFSLMFLFSRRGYW